MIQEFQTYLTAIKGYSQSTAEGYGKDLRDFAKHMKETREGARWTTINREDIDAYVIKLDGAGMTPATINRRIAAIKAAYKYMKRQGIITESPAQYMTMHKRTKRIPNTIPAADLNAAIQGTSGTIHVMLRLLTATGIRIQELIDIKQSDVEAAEMRIKINGKGRKERYVYVDETTLKEIQEYFAGRPEQPFGGISQREIRHAIWQTLRKYTTARQLSPHAIRHTYATELAKQGINVTTLASILGHEDIRTTQHYIDMAQSDTKQAQTTHKIIN